MKKLTYWIADCLNDSDAYSFRAKTRKEVVAYLKQWEADGESPEAYGKPRKVTFEYIDAFDLLNECLSESRGFWETP